MPIASASVFVERLQFTCPFYLFVFFSHFWRHMVNKWMFCPESNLPCFQMLYGKWQFRIHCEKTGFEFFWFQIQRILFWTRLTNARSVLRSKIRFWFRRKEHTLSWIAQNIQDIAHKKPVSPGSVKTYWCYLLIKITNKQCRCWWLGFPFPALCNCLKSNRTCLQWPLFFLLVWRVARYLSPWGSHLHIVLQTRTFFEGRPFQEKALQGNETVTYNKFQINIFPWHFVAKNNAAVFWSYFKLRVLVQRESVSS